MLLRAMRSRIIPLNPGLLGATLFLSTLSALAVTPEQIEELVPRSPQPAAGDFEAGQGVLVWPSLANPALAPVGVMLAIFGYVLGTYAALLCAFLLEFVYGVM